MIVAVETDEGVTGWGEMAPLGAFYSEAFPAGARAGVAELAPHLIGADPCRRAGRGAMDAAMRGQPYVKSALDMACWDAAARLHGQPLCEALGGRFGAAVDLYRSLSAGPAAAGWRTLAATCDAGYLRLQVKVGGDPEVDAARLAAVRDAAGAGVVLFADANGAWSRPPPPAASCSRRPGSTTRSSSRAPRSRSARRCGRTARTRSSWTSRSCRSRRSFTRAATRAPTASRSRSPGSAA